MVDAESCFKINNKNIPSITNHNFVVSNHKSVSLTLFRYYRYQNKDTVEYGLPKDVPKPAPPKTKKSDIVEPTTFTVADRIVDQVG